MTRECRTEIAAPTSVTGSWEKTYVQLKVKVSGSAARTEATSDMGDSGVLVTRLSAIEASRKP